VTLIRAELLKIVTTYRTILGILLAEIALVTLATIAHVHDAARQSVLPPRFAPDLVGIAATSLLFTTLLGVLIATTEYRHGTVTLTFLATPVRERVLAAKSVAAIVCGALLVVPAVLIPVVIATIWVGDRPDYHFGGEEWGLVGRLFLTAALVSILGLFIGSALTRQLGAIILVLAWVLFVEPAITALFPGTNDYLVGPSLGGVLGGDTNALSFGRAFPVLAAYLVVLGALAVFLTRRRDIT
jgi:hypothetical protein